MATSLLDFLPKHKCGLTIQHNEHKNYYECARDYIYSSNLDNLDWESQEELDKAINTDEIWTMTWYPETPIGSYSIAASTLESLLLFASKGEKI